MSQGANMAMRLMGPEALARELDRMNTELERLKSTQYVSSNNIRIASIPSTGYVSLSAVIAAGGSIAFTLGVNPGDQTLTLWNYLSSIFVDVEGDVANLYSGLDNTLTAGQKHMVKSDWLDYAESGDVTNFRSFKTRVINLDSVSHTYYWWARVYAPLTPGTANL